MRRFKKVETANEELTMFEQPTPDDADQVIANARKFLGDGESDRLDIDDAVAPFVERAGAQSVLFAPDTVAREYTVDGDVRVFARPQGEFAIEGAEIEIEITLVADPDTQEVQRVSVGAVARG